MKLMHVHKLRDNEDIIDAKCVMAKTIKRTYINPRDLKCRLNLSTAEILVYGNYDKSIYCERTIK